MHISCSYTNNFLQVFWLLLCDDAPCCRNALFVWKYKRTIKSAGRSQWPRSLRRGSVASRRFESRRGHGFLSLVNVVCCQVEVSASGWSLVQRSSTQYGVSECDREAAIRRTGFWPTRGCCAMVEKHRRCCVWRFIYYFPYNCHNNMFNELKRT